MSAGDSAAVSAVEGKLAELSTSCDLRTLPRRGKVYLSSRPPVLAYFP
jgi:hypothetical protein